MKSIKKRILLLIKIPPPITGATLMNKQVYDSECIRQNFDIRSITLSYANSVSDLGKVNFSKIKIFLKTIFRLNKELIFERPNVVYFQLSPIGFVFYRDLIYIIFIKFFRVKILFHLHGKGISEMASNRIQYLLYRFAFKNSDIICLSELLKYDVKSVFDGKIHIVNNGIPEMGKPKPKTENLTENEKVKLLFLSNLIKSKGILDFISALKLLNKRGIPFKAIIVGGEGDINKEELNIALKKNNLTSIVEYVGPKYGKEKKEIYAVCDVVVFPTKNDTWGNVVLEAMQFAKPVVATNEGSIPEIIDNGVTGFIVDKAAPEQIAKKIEFLINNTGTRKKMGIAARDKYLEKYTVSIFENNLSRVFDKV